MDKYKGCMVDIGLDGGFVLHGEVKEINNHEIILYMLNNETLEEGIINKRKINYISTNVRNLQKKAKRSPKANSK